MSSRFTIYLITFKKDVTHLKITFVTEILIIGVMGTHSLLQKLHALHVLHLL